VTIDLLIKCGSFTGIGETETYAVGHFAFGYVLGKLTTKATKTKMNIPLILMLSVIQDVDILVPYVEHRGPFHSVIMAAIVFLPLLIRYGRTAYPYFLALVQHSLVGDLIAGGRVQLLWPLSSQQLGIEINIKDPANITLEWLIFAVAAVIFLKTKDIHWLLKPHNSNLILAIPTFTVLLPTFLAFPLEVPIALVPPHIICLILFLASLAIDSKKIVKLALS
jgi:hypothetical protein